MNRVSAPQRTPIQVNSTMTATAKVVVRRLGRQDYAPVFETMRAFSLAARPCQDDEIWLLEHNPVFTQGINGKPEHLLAPGDIPVVETDRGGQVTYHGPGQLVVYLLLDVKARGLGVRQLVTTIEQSVVELVERWGIQATAMASAPGVYVGERKLASLGLRIRRGRCYHGLSLNVAMDLAPFQRIDPCGFAGLQMTQLRDLGADISLHRASEALLPILIRNLGYTGGVEHRGLPTLECPPQPPPRNAGLNQDPGR